MAPAVVATQSGLFDDSPCECCQADYDFLRQQHQPPLRRTGPMVRIVDLFCGCGGMSLGLREAARRSGARFEIAFAADSSVPLLDTFVRNLAPLSTSSEDVSSLFSEPLGADKSRGERRLKRHIGPVDLLVGGPPCQGHSNLNNHTRGNDPKNTLLLRMVRAAQVLRPACVAIENVASVERDSLGVTAVAIDQLEHSGYRVAAKVLDLSRIGVPQRRRRFLLLASRIDRIDSEDVLAQLARGTLKHPPRSVRWAIEDLEGLENRTDFDTAARSSQTNAARIDYLFDNDLFDLPNSQRPICHRYGGHSYISMYGRLQWDAPAQTVTTGFGSIGQGRYVHPSRRRALTPHEAARLQTFPDWFSYPAASSRGIVATGIGNAVPPLLMVKLGQRLFKHLLSAGAGK